MLKDAGQWWKLQVTIGAIVVGFVLMLLGIISLQKERIGFLFVVIGLAVGISAFVFACLAIRCPSCGARWFWRAVRNQRAGDWFLSLLRIEKCDVCSNVYSRRESDHTSKFSAHERPEERKPRP